MVDDKPTKITIFILGALSWAVHIGVAWRRRSTNRHISRRTVQRLSDHEKIEPLREYRICDSDVFVSQRMDVPRHQPKTIYGGGSRRHRRQGRSRLLSRRRSRQASLKTRMSRPSSPYSVQEEDFSCGTRYA